MPGRASWCGGSHESHLEPNARITDAQETQDQRLFHVHALTQHQVTMEIKQNSSYHNLEK